jgi:hypothetical protein
MNNTRQILIEGYTPDEILSFPEEMLNEYVFLGEPILFKAGSAEILGKFQKTSDRLIIELAQIEGGGEGVLPTIWLMAERYAIQKQLDIEWIVHAVHCAKPNLKLKRVLERRGFQIKDISGIGEAYYLFKPIRNEPKQMIGSPRKE